MLDPAHSNSVISNSPLFLLLFFIFSPFALNLPFSHLEMTDEQIYASDKDSVKLEMRL